jgi:hypothetical protein
MEPRNSPLQRSSSRRSFLHTAAVGAGGLTALSSFGMGRLLRAAAGNGSPSVSSNDPITVWLKRHAIYPSAATAGSSVSLGQASSAFIKTADPFVKKMWDTSDIPDNHAEMAAALHAFSDNIGTFKSAINYHFVLHPHTAQPTTKTIGSMVDREHEMGYSSLTRDRFTHRFRASDLDAGGKRVAVSGLGTLLYKGAEIVKKGWDQESALRGMHLKNANWATSLGSYLINISSGLLATSGTVALIGGALLLDPATAPIGIAAEDAALDLGYGGIVFYGFGYLLEDVGGLYCRENKRIDPQARS